MSDLQHSRRLPCATMSRPPALARSDSPDSEMEDEGAPDDFGDLLAEIGVIRTMYSRPELTAVSSDSLTDLLEVENQTDGVRKEKLRGVKGHIVGMSEAYAQLLQSFSHLSEESSAEIALLRAQLQAAEGRAVNAERTCSEFKEDLQKILDWLAGGQSALFPKLMTTPTEHSGSWESHKLSQAQASLAQEQEKVSTLQQELHRVGQELSGRERKAREDRQRLEKEVMEVQGRVDQAEAALAQYKQLLVEQRERDSTLETQLVVVKGENAELRTEVDRNLAELERLKKCVFESGAAVDLRDSKINDLQRALSEEQQKVSLGCAAQEGLETQLSQQSAERDQLLGEKEGLEGKVQQCSEELEELRRHIEELQQSKAALEGELSQQQGEVGSLQASHSQAQTDIEALRKDISAKEDALRQLMAALHGLVSKVCGTLAGGGEEEEEEFAILQGHADTLDESLRTVLHEIEQLREKWAESQAAIREQESRLGRLGGERDRLAGEIEALQERIAGLEQVLEQRDSTDANFQDTISQLQRDLQCTRSDYDKAVAEREAVAMAMQELQGDLVSQQDLLQGQLARQQAALEELGRAQEKLKVDYSKCCDEVSSKQRSVQALEEELREREAELDALSSQLDSASVDREGLHLQLDEYRSQMATLQSEMKAREEEKDCQLQEVVADREALREEHEKIQRMVEEREKMLAGLKKTASDLDTQRKRAQKDVARHRDVIASLERKLQEVQGDFDGLHSQLSEREKELHACREAAILTSDTMNEKIRQLTLELQALRLSHTSQLSAIQSEYSSASRCLQSHESLARAREEEVRGLSLRVAELEAELAGLTLKNEACEEQLQQERQAGGALQEELGVKEAELSARETQLGRAQEGLKQMEEKLRSYESDHKDVLSLVGQLRGPKQKWVDLGSNIHNEELKEELKDLEEVLQELWDGQADLGQQISQMMEALTKAEFEKKALQTKLSSEQEDHHLLQERVHQQECDKQALREKLADEQAKLGEQTDEKDSLQLRCDSLAKKESVIQSQLREALHQLGVAHSQTSKDAALITRLQRQAEDHQQQVEELHNHNTEHQTTVQQLKELAEERERELLQCQATSERLRVEEGRRVTLEQELKGAREQLTQAIGRLAEEQARCQGVQEEVELLQAQLNTVQGEAAQLKSAKSQVELQLSEQQLSDQEEVERVRTKLSSIQTQLHTYVIEIRSLKEELQKTGAHAKEAEEEVERLKNSLSAAQRAHLLTQKELLTTRSSLGSSQELAQRLQQDCDTLANQMSSWAQDHRVSQETMSERLRALQKDIATLQADKESLTRRTEVLDATNSKLKTQLEWASTVCRTMKTPGVDGPGTSTKTPGSHRSNSVTRVQATLDVSFKHKQSSGHSSSGSELADTSLDWESQYASALQKGLSASKLQGGNGEFPSVSLKRENSDGMDKQYWMTRANELSLQLQQCTEFWSEKVRLLSSQLEESGKKKP